jgi:hypothetical protein
MPNSCFTVTAHFPQKKADMITVAFSKEKIINKPLDITTKEPPLVAPAIAVM